MYESIKKTGCITTAALWEQMQDTAFSLEKQLGVPANSKGCGGIIDIALMIPESAVLFVAPIGCCRHVTTHSNQRGERMFALALEEKDIVTGHHQQYIQEALLEVDRRVHPAIIVVIGSCIDRLMATDYEHVARGIAGQVQAEIRVMWMDPVVGRKEHPQVRTWRDAYAIWDKNEGAPENAVNIITRLHAPSASSDQRTLLQAAGVEKVRFMTDCKSLAEYKEMGKAGLNIIGTKLGRKAAKYLQEKNHMPYVEAFSTLDPDKVHRVYGEIGQALGREIPDAALWQDAKERAADFRERRREDPISVAIGESYATSENALSIAADAAKLGLDVKYIYSDGKLSGKEKEIAWLAEHCPETQIILLNYPASREMVIDPPAVEMAWGMCDKCFKRRKGSWLDPIERPIHCDYESIRWFMEKAEEMHRK